MQELEFHPAADREVTEAAEFFETQRTGLGDGFVDEFEAGLPAVPLRGKSNASRSVTNL